MNSDSYVLQRVDGLIANYQYSNKGRVPKGVKMNSANANELRDAVRLLNRLPDDLEITKFRGC
jgi:hypothetical protein